MAGGYGHIVQKDGNLAPKSRIVGSLEADDDVFETIQEMYGMIWHLAQTYAYGNPKAAVHEARAQYRDGLKMAEEVNG